MALLPWIAKNMPWTPIAQGIRAAQEQEFMQKYRQQMMDQQALERQQLSAAQGMFKPGDPHPEQIPVTPQVGSPNYGQARQQLDQTSIGTASPVDYLKGPQSQIAQGLAKAGLFTQAGNVLEKHAPQDQVWRDETANGLPGQRHTGTNEFNPFPQQASSGRNTFRQMSDEELRQWKLPLGTVAALGADGKPDVIFNPQARDAAGPKGTWAGNSIEAQDSNILQNGNPASQEYAIAYARQAAPRVLPDGSRITPDMRPFPKPKFGEYGAEQQPGSPPARAPGQQTMEPGQLRSAKAMRVTMGRLIDNTKSALKNVTQTDTAAYMTSGVATPKLTTALTAFQLVLSQLRDPSLLNTGVLQAGELQWINSFMQAPGTFQALLQGDQSTVAALDQVMTLLDARTAGFEAIDETRPQSGQSDNADGQAPPPAGVDASVWQFMTPEERALWK